jgi:hypothetical protein
MHMIPDIETRMITLIGDPLAQSFAARMQNKGYEAAGLNLVYFYTVAGNEHLGDIVNGLRYMPFAGFAVTKPNKVKVLEYLDELDPLCAKMGSSNTVVRTPEGKLIGSCCRCGDPLTVDVHLKTSFLFTKTESEADSMPISEDGEDEVVVGSSHFDVANWVQEELLLKLPLYPAHDVCKAPELPTDEEEELEDARPNPFAVLSSLKKH